LGTQVEVIEPVELREIVLELAQSVVAFYANAKQQPSLISSETGKPKF
jgi:hypothetical protein